MYSIPDKTKGGGVSATFYEHDVNLILLYVCRMHATCVISFPFAVYFCMGML